MKCTGVLGCIYFSLKTEYNIINMKKSKEKIKNKEIIKTTMDKNIDKSNLKQANKIRMIINKEYKLIDLKNRKILVITVVEDEDKNISENKIPASSPIAQALVDKKVGDIIETKYSRYKILKLK